MSTCFPALKSLGELAQLHPTILVDSREQDPLIFHRFKSVSAPLTTGDYSIAGFSEIFAVERKTIGDLIGCCVGDNRERFERELHRLRGYRFKRLLVVGDRSSIEGGYYRSRISPLSVLGSLSAFEVRYDCPVVFAPTPEDAALEIERWCWYFCREHVEAANGLLRATKAIGPHKN
jgi:DNA excision repair protein ERCC-4